MKKYLLSFLFLFVFSNAFTQTSVFFTGTFEQAKEKAMNEDKFIVLDISSDG
ncbi:hypothetical protein ACFL6G_04150 [candidate division KSB1 bacterium]